MLCVCVSACGVCSVSVSVFVWCMCVGVCCVYMFCVTMCLWCVIVCGVFLSVCMFFLVCVCGVCVYSVCLYVWCVMCV